MGICASKELIGTTSACAENTHPIGWWSYRWWNYLRVRGEYLAAAVLKAEAAELPPHARRIHPNYPGCHAGGTTSACAENTNDPCGAGTLRWNYLRARGEYDEEFSQVGDPVELPPRTRRIPMAPFEDQEMEGTTSAHAENTWRSRCRCRRKGNYLRARGEYFWREELIAHTMELPPRTRRIHGTHTAPGCVRGTTSAHAENTTTDDCAMTPAGNYLRVRGEYRPRPPHFSQYAELPPRARRILRPHD